MPENFWETVDTEGYYCGVLKNMREHGAGPGTEGRVQFGVTGTGYSPSYEIVSGFPIRGQNHMPHKETADGAFHDANLSERSYSYEEIERFERDALDRASAPD